MAPYLCFSSSLCDDLKDTGGICVSSLEAPEHRGDTEDEIQTTEGRPTKGKGPSFGLILETFKKSFFEMTAGQEKFDSVSKSSSILQPNS